MRIDFHFHFIREKGFIERTLNSMDEGKVDKALLVPFTNFVFQMIGGKQCGDNEDVLRAVQAHPARFIGCIYIDPRNPATVSTLDKYYEQGFKCIKMHPAVGYYPNDPRWDPIYEHIGGLGLPILIHGGWTQSYLLEDGEKKYLNSALALPEYIDHPARKHQNVNFIVAHMAQPYFMQAYSLADHNPNVYLDICLRYPQKDILAKLCENVNLFEYIDPNRIVWGTDNWLSHSESIQENIRFLEKVKVAEKHYKKIFGETAAKLLRIR